MFECFAEFQKSATLKRGREIEKNGEFTTHYSSKEIKVIVQSGKEARTGRDGAFIIKSDLTLLTKCKLEQFDLILIDSIIYKVLKCNNKISYYESEVVFDV